jgi:L-idonate 5-dehydrogenase
LLGRRVLVTGSGPIGVLCMPPSRRRRQIVATDIADAPPDRRPTRGRSHDKRRQDARRAGYADKGSFDVLFEASGNSQALAAAFDILKPRHRG